jgi:tetratricopeptide (TPR) repeat protein
VAQQADPEPWRDRLRDPAAWENLDMLAALAQQVPPKAVTPSLAAAVGERLRKKLQGDKLLRAAQALRPNDFLINYALGSTLAEVDANQAEGFFRAALAARPESADAYLNLGYVVYRQGRLEEAEALTRSAIDLDPENEVALNNLGDLLNRLGRSGEAAGPLRQAEVLARRAVERAPKDADAYASLSEVLDSEGKHQESEVVIRKAVELDPKTAGYYMTLGEQLVYQGKPGEAIAYMRKAVELSPEVAMYHNDVGWALEQQGNLDDAAAWYRKATDIDPKSSAWLSNLARVLNRQGKLYDATTAYNRLIELNPKNAAAHHDLADILLRRGRPDDAAIHRRRAAELDLDSARLCRYQGRFADAARRYAAAFADDPKLADDLRSGHRFDAARAAALAGCGTGMDAPGSEDQERARLRGQARAWLRADLSRYSRQLASGPGEKAAATERLRRWVTDEDLAGIRDAAALATLPQAERKAWEAFWAEVKAVLANPPAK